MTALIGACEIIGTMEYSAYTKDMNKDKVVQFFESLANELKSCSNILWIKQMQKFNEAKHNSNAINDYIQSSTDDYTSHT